MSLTASDVQLLTSLTRLLTTVVLPPDRFNCGRRHERGLSSCPHPEDVQNERHLERAFTRGNTTAALYAEFPWLASVRGGPADGSSVPISVCGGVLVHSQAILISGACYEEATNQNLQLSVRLAEYHLNSEVDYGYKGTDAQIAKVVFHPDYKKMGDAVAYDVALLILRYPVQLDDTIDVVCLPWESGLHRQETKTDNWEQQQCQVAGWSDPRIGLTDIVYYEKVKYLSRDTCQKLLRKKLRLGPFQELHHSFVCAQPDQDCWADIGSALVCRAPKSPRWTLVGLVPWSRPFQQCDTAVSFSNVALITDWIESAIDAEISV